MCWFRSRQSQKIQDNNVTNSPIFQVQVYVLTLFGLRQSATGIDWTFARKVMQEQHAYLCARREDELLNDTPMAVQMLPQPERVNWAPLKTNQQLKIAGQDSELLDPEQLIIEVFRRNDIKGQLLILGTPGAGKTTVLLSLAKQLLDEAIKNPKTEIPIVFELSTWKNDNQSIRDWLIEQLYDLYGDNLKLKQYEQWLDQRVLLPLLDGLDELGMERQKKCMAKLNEFTRHYPRVVVCCRSKEFEESGIRLENLRGAVELQPLSDRQIQTYLDQVERSGLWTQIQETPEMQQMLEPTKEGESGLLRVPLFVSLAASIYEADQPFRSKEELLERYIDRQLSCDVRSRDRRKGLERREWAYATVKKEPKVKETRKYLAWLAWQLQSHHEVALLIEKMQSSWLSNEAQIWWYRVISWAMVGFPCVLLGVLLSVLLGYPLDIGLKSGLIWAMNCCLFLVLSGEMGGKIVTVETWKLTNLNRDQLELVGIVLLVVIELSCICIFGLIGLMYPLGGLIFGICLWLGFVFKNSSELKTTSYPNQGTHRSAIQGLGYGLWGVVVVALIFVVAGEWFSALVFGVAAMFVLGLLTGGGAFIKHYALRLVLRSSGFIRWYYARFLNYCTERLLLQRIGGRYRFIHRELLDHFAKDYELNKF